ncbi:MAG: tetraacyldisaccharide 4'-kinase [Algisphaera sp.]
MAKRKRWRMSQARMLRIMSGQDRDWRARVLRPLSNAGVPPYRAAVAVRNAMYTMRLRGTKRLGLPTISVGNVTAGGTGKTPMVIELVDRLQAMGHRPAVLLRGYEPSGLESKLGSDEAAVLRGALGEDVPVRPNANRVKAAAVVRAERPDVTVFVLDDGFQHRRVARDLNLVLIDASRPFGHGRLLPRGLLREPLRALRRADALIVTRGDRVSPEALKTLVARLTRLHGKPPVAVCRHRWSGFRIGYKDYPLDRLRETAVLGASGLGNPADFEASLRAVTGKVVGCAVFDDHHPYTRSDVRGVMNMAQERGAQAVVTTEKDWVKWRRLAGGVKLKLPVYRPRVQMAFLDEGVAAGGEDALDALLRHVAPQPTSERESS